MTLSGPLCLGVRVALAFVLGATLLLAVAAPAYANGVHVGSRQVFEGDAGPYRLILTTTPVTGSMHFIILLSTAGEESPVSDPELTMRGVFIDGEGLEVGPVAGYATMEGPALVRRGPARGDGGPMGVHPDRGRYPGARRGDLPGGRAGASGREPDADRAHRRGVGNIRIYAWQSNVWPAATSFASRPGFKLGRRQP